MNSKVFETVYYQIIKVAKFWDFTTGIIRKQNRKDFVELV